MTNGGPLDSTISMSMYTYKQFGFGNYGYAAAMSYIIFVVIAIVTAIQFRLLRERTDREATRPQDTGRQPATQWHWWLYAVLTVAVAGRRRTVRLDGARQPQERGRAAPGPADVVARRTRPSTTTRSCSPS